MQRFLVRSLRGAMSRLRDQAQLVGPANVDESTFRSFVLAEIMSACPSACCQTEWEKLDLLVQMRETNFVVEFKFYFTRRMFALDGTPGRWKSGASLQNQNEFRDCIRKLRNLKVDGIRSKYIVLVYERHCTKGGKYSFASSYDGLRADEVIKMVRTVRHNMQEQAVCKLLEIR